MKIIIKTKNLELTNSLQEFVAGKISSLKKFIDILKEDRLGKGNALTETLVEVDRETNHHRKGMIFLVKIQMNLPGKLLVVSSEGDDIFKTIIEAIDELKVEIEKYKFKKTDKNRKQMQSTEK
jgi:ribosomal subunit interface protein